MEQCACVTCLARATIHGGDSQSTENALIVHGQPIKERFVRSCLCTPPQSTVAVLVLPFQVSARVPLVGACGWLCTQFDPHPHSPLRMRCESKFDDCCFRIIIEKLLLLPWWQNGGHGQSWPNPISSQSGPSDQ